MINKSEFLAEARNQGYKVKGNLCQCPAHGGSKLSLHVNDGTNGLLLFCHSNHCEFVDIMQTLGLLEHQSKSDFVRKKRGEPKEIAIVVNEYAKKMLSKYVALMHKDKMIETKRYWNKRRLLPVLPLLSQDISFISHKSCIFSLVRDKNDKIISGHRTILNEGLDTKNEQKLLPAITDRITSGAHIKVLDGLSVPTIHIAEGLETIMSVIALNGLSRNNIKGTYWSCINSNGMKKLEIPRKFTQIFIYADIDKKNQGQEAAKVLAKRYDAEIITPCTQKYLKDVVKKKSYDFNDFLIDKLNK
jgi:hypothetical protein